MKNTGSILSVLLVAACGVSAVAAEPLSGRDGFALGCNYWASHAGTEMWRRWDADVVEKDFAALEAHGVGGRGSAPNDTVNRRGGFVMVDPSVRRLKRPVASRLKCVILTNGGGPSRRTRGRGNRL